MNIKRKKQKKNTIQSRRHSNEYIKLFSLCQTGEEGEVRRSDEGYREREVEKHRRKEKEGL